MLNKHFFIKIYDIFQKKNITSAISRLKVGSKCLTVSHITLNKRLNFLKLNAYVFSPKTLFL